MCRIYKQLFLITIFAFSSFIIGMESEETENASVMLNWQADSRRQQVIFGLFGMSIQNLKECLENHPQQNKQGDDDRASFAICLGALREGTKYISGGTMPFLALEGNGESRFSEDGETGLNSARGKQVSDDEPNDIETGTAPLSNEETLALGLGRLRLIEKLHSAHIVKIVIRKLKIIDSLFKLLLELCETIDQITEIDALNDKLLIAFADYKEEIISFLGDTNLAVDCLRDGVQVRVTLADIIHEFAYKLDLENLKEQQEISHRQATDFLRAHIEEFMCGARELIYRLYALHREDFSQQFEALAAEKSYFRPGGPCILF